MGSSRVRAQREVDLLMMNQLLHFLQAYLLTGSLIMVIGAQNAYVLKMGLLRQHNVLIAAVCILCDVLLIFLGMQGFNALFTDHPRFEFSVALAGGLFLTVYGWYCFRAAVRGTSYLSIVLNKDKTISRSRAFFSILAFTFLNPQAYFDTLVMIGGNGAHQPTEYKTAFFLGATSASTIWFCCLSFGARYLEPWFRSKRMWQYFDTLIGIVMWGMAVYLVWPYFFDPAVSSEIKNALT